MASRYLQKDQHPGTCTISSIASPTWKRMIRVKDAAEENMVTIVRQGNSPFSFEDWSHEGSLSSFKNSQPLSDLSISQAWSGQNWNEAAILASHPDFNINLLAGRSVLLVQGEDHIAWKGISDSEFKASAAVASKLQRIQVRKAMTFPPKVKPQGPWHYG
ncbi:hypothetical protein ACH5RR_023182 [Cinchona calisaya]|uniref:Uncharacterized protein n=1 Tax=Cinchona calisaya TaxID=153742 RepID=A0ABD2ZD87_9GENT